MKAKQSNNTQFRQIEKNELREISGGDIATTIDGVTYDGIGFIGEDGRWRPHGSTTDGWGGEIHFDPVIVK